MSLVLHICLLYYSEIKQPNVLFSICCANVRNRLAEEPYPFKILFFLFFLADLVCQEKKRTIRSAKKEKKHHKVCQEKKRTIKGYGSAAINRLTKLLITSVYSLKSNMYLILFSIKF